MMTIKILCEKKKKLEIHLELRNPRVVVRFAPVLQNGLVRNIISKSAESLNECDTNRFSTGVHDKDTLHPNFEI